MSRNHKAELYHNKRKIIFPFKVWKCSDIWEQFYQIKIQFRKKLRANWSQGMLAIFRCRIFCLLDR